MIFGSESTFPVKAKGESPLALLIVEGSGLVAEHGSDPFC